jgi:dTDP-4-amino-4,6-dideoxygalactose transaminase
MDSRVVCLPQSRPVDPLVEHRHRSVITASAASKLKELPVKLRASGDGENLHHARHLYPMELSGEAPISRDDLLTARYESKSGAGLHDRGGHLHPYYADKYGIAPDSLPVATAISSRTLSLPLSPKLTYDDLGDVVLQSGPRSPDGRSFL